MLAAYWGVRSNGFVAYDDDQYVAENPQVQKGLSGESVAWALSTTQASNWHPVTWLSHMLDVQLFGLDAGCHHWTSLLIHCANAVLLFLLLFRMTGAVWRSAFVAALFALHPVHVESVAWIAERKDVLSTLFWLLTLFAWLAFVKSKRAAPYALALVLFALGLMAKPMLVTLPFTLLLFDYWPLHRLALPLRGSRERIKALLWEKAPIFAMSAASCAITAFAQRAAIKSFDQLPLGDRAANAVWAYVGYLAKMLWPSRLSIFYPMPPGGHPVWQVVMAASLLLGLSAGALRLARRGPYLLFGWCWYLGTLVPVIGLVQVGGQAMADRYTYVPLVGLFIAGAWAIGEWTGKRPWSRAVTVGAAAAALLALSAATRAHIGYWSNSRSLFERALAVTTDNYLAHNNLGAFLFINGRREEAIAHYREAIRIQPLYAQAHDNLGVALVKTGRLEEALDHYQAALRVEPANPGLNARTATVLVMLDRRAEAGGFLDRALAGGGDTFDAHYSIAMALQAVGRLPEALEQCRRALESKPDSAPAVTCLGQIQGRLGRLPEAIDTFKRALQIDPECVDALLNLAVALDHQDRTQEALECLDGAVKLDPALPVVSKITGMALARLNRFAEAIPHLQKAAACDPRDAEAQVALGRALAMEGRFPEARDRFRDAVRLRPDDAELRAVLESVLKAIQAGR